eukprot:12754937-Prorocentrum_lima.AAC.1
MLWNIYILDSVRRLAENWKSRGLGIHLPPHEAQWQDSWLGILVYADDIVLLTDTVEHLQVMTYELQMT